MTTADRDAAWAMADARKGQPRAEGAQRVGEKWYVGDWGHAVRVIMFVGATLAAGKGPACG